MAELNELTINGSNYTFEDDVARGLATAEERRARAAEQSLQTAINGKVDKVSGKGLSTNDYTNDEKAKLAGLNNYDDTQVRQLIAQTNANFANYYTKTESYSATEVDTLLRTQRQGQFVVVSTLPTPSADTMFKIYLVPSTNPETQNVKDEFVTLESNGTYSWEQIGTTAVDLSGYSTTEEMNAAIASALTSYYTKSEVDTSLGNKQDTISDLSDIRSGAQAGSTAVQPPTLNNVVKNMVAESGVYDVSANNDNTKFESLSALLSSANLNTLIPTGIRKGGMSIKFVLSSDNKYVQCRYMSSSTAVADFTNVANWQGVDEEPTVNSENLVKSGGVYENTFDVNHALGHINKLIGRGPTIDYITITPVLEHVYQLEMLDTDWEAGTLTPGNSIFYLSGYNGSRYDNNIDSVLSQDWDTQKPSSKYVFRWKDNISTNGTLRLGIRAAVGTEIRYRLTDVTADYKDTVVGVNIGYTSIRYDNLIRGHKYRVSLKNTEWQYDKTSGNTNTAKFDAASYVDETNFVILFSVIKSAALEDTYEFTVPEDSSFIKIGGRANNGEVIRFQLEDVTDIYDIYEYVNTADQKLIIGDIVQGVDNKSGIVNSTYTTLVCQASIASIPCIPCTMHFKLPSDVRAVILSGQYAGGGNINHDSGWIYDKGQYTIPDSDLFYRIHFGNNKKTDILPQKVIDYINNGDIEITYHVEEQDIVQRNEDCTKYAKAVTLNLLSGNQQAGNMLNKMGIFAHISDLHGDAYRYFNCMEYAKWFGTDALLVSGDSVPYHFGNGNFWLKDGTKKYGVKMLTCVGNHEVWHSTAGNNDTIFNDYIYPYVTDNNYMESDGVLTTHPYYYRDFEDKQIRVIALNQYDCSIYGGQNRGGKLGQAQITWLINTLLSTPVGYGIIIMMHAYEGVVEKPASFSEFNQKVFVGTYMNNGFYVNTVRPIMKIIDAFISRNSNLDFTYTEVDSTGTIQDSETISVTADFSGVDSSIEFICYVCGHRHEDVVGYYADAENPQLVITVTSGTAHYGVNSNHTALANQEDLPRGPKGPTQDAFNIYAIDRVNKVVKIARIGANMTFQLEDRKCMIASYIDRA